MRAAKYPTETGAVWYVDPDSVETKIEEIRQVQETLHQPAAPSYDTPPPTADDTSRPDADRRVMSSSESQPDRSDTTRTTDGDDPRQQNYDAASRVSGSNTNESEDRQRHATTNGDDKYVTVPVVVLDALTEQLAAKDEQIKRQDAQLERLVDANTKDRQLLGAALSIIHKDDFPTELGGTEKLDWESQPEPAEEVKPEFGRGGGNPQAGQSGFSV